MPAIWISRRTVRLWIDQTLRLDTLTNMKAIRSHSRGSGPRPARRRGGPGLMVMGLAWLVAGGGLLFGLSQLPSRLDTLLYFSTALGNITMGLLQLSYGLLQLGGALVLILLAVAGLMLMLGGVLRLSRLLLGQGGHRRPGSSLPPDQLRRPGRPASTYLLDAIQSPRR